MSNQSRDPGAVNSVAIALLSLVLGMGAAGAAVAAVLSAAPDDASAVQTGPSEQVDPGTIINYGG